jgi:hypothetical protein
MKIVKVSYPAGDSARWGSFLRQSPGSSGVWGDYKFVINQDIPECDYWVVYDQIPKTETCRCPESNTIFITGESPCIGAYPSSFLNQFHNVITSHNDILENRRLVCNVDRYMPGLPWIVNKTYDELTAIPPIEKTKVLSLITSTKHKKRYYAALELKEYFGDRLVLFGDGIRPVGDKWTALAPYKYTISLENCRQNDYISEKLTDCYLAYTFPFYFGALNIGGNTFRGVNLQNDYFPVGSYVHINISNIDRCIEIIESTLRNQKHYENAIPSLQIARNNVLNKYNLFPLIIDYINMKKLDYRWPKSRITISDKGRLMKNIMMFLKKEDWIP